MDRLIVIIRNSFTFCHLTMCVLFFPGLGSQNDNDLLFEHHRHYFVFLNDHLMTTNDNQ